MQEPLTLQNQTYGVPAIWRWTEKVDGTNVRVIYTPPSHQYEWVPATLEFHGKTNNAQLHKDLVRWLTENITVAMMEKVFPDATEQVVLYGEGYGAGIQKGGGSYSATKKFILFDVFLRDTNTDNTLMGGWWLSYENVADVADKLGIDVVADYGEMSLEDAALIVRVGVQSSLAYGNGTTVQAEGLIGRPLETLYDKRGKRLIVKLKTKDFAK